MSIIYDALKKVQKNISNEKTPQVDTPPAAQPAKFKLKINPILTYVLVVSLGLVVGNFAYKQFSRSKNLLPDKSLPQTTPLSQAVNKTETTPKPAAPATPPGNPEPTLVLNGVFFEQGEGYALINNKIVRIGEEVNNAKVKEIAITGVELEFEGKTIKLASPS